jgi:type I restriction enzyme S subunit
MNNPSTLPEGWHRFSFGEIARNVSEYETKPLEKGLDRCVGLDHIEPGSLHIKRWNMMSNESSFTRKFKKGQVLFGKRRAYQRKVALAEFDGICSSDILVFEANTEKVVPELVPFIVQDDRFFDFAIGTSSGSLSPRTKWKFLSTYKVPLPSKEEQQKISSFLWAAEDCIVKNERFIQEAERAKRVLMRKLFNKGIGYKKFRETEKTEIIPSDWHKVKLSEVISLKKGRKPNNLSETPTNDTVPYLTADYFRTGIPSQHVNISKDNSAISVTTRDIVFIWDGSNAGDVFYGLKGVLASTMAIIRADQKNATNEWIYYILKIHFSTFNTQTTGSAIPHVNKNLFLNLQIPLPPLTEQRQIVAILTQFDKIITTARTNLDATKALKMKLINQFFQMVDR